MAKRSLKDIEINKELFKKIWQTLNETKVEDILLKLKNNKKTSLLVSGAILSLIGLGLLIKFNMNVLGGTTEQLQTPPAGLDGQLPTATFLPQTQRTEKDKPELKDPFAGKILLKGIMTGGGGDNLAIIEVGNTSFIAGAATELTGGLTVAEVKSDEVILTKGDQRITLDMKGRNKTEALKTSTDATPTQTNAKTKTVPAPTQGESDSGQVN